MVPKEFFTPAKYENSLYEQYKKEVKEKQEEIDLMVKQTGKIHKYKGSHYIHHPRRVFWVCEKGIFVDGVPMPTSQEEGGCIYRFEPKYSCMKQVEEFFERNKEFCVEFYKTSKYGNSIGYCCEKYVHVALLKSESEEVLIEDEDSYDILYL